MKIIKKHTQEVIYENKDIEDIGELLEEAVKKGIDLEGADLSKLVLNNLDLRCAKLAEASFAFSILNKINLQSADLDHAIFDSSTINDSNLSHCNMLHTSFEDALLINVAAPSSKISGTWFENAHLVNVNLSNSFTNDETKPHEGFECNFKNTHIGNSKFECAELNFANFENSTIHDCSFKYSMLPFANFKYTKSFNCDFRGADIKNTIFEKIALEDKGDGNGCTGLYIKNKEEETK
jgi:uncharacterized protein YjbI with pentapeptide repeats